MNILPKKRWHVRTKDNIARVRRDEAAAREEEEKRLEKLKIAESEARINFLRRQSGLPECQTSIDSTPNKAEHIDLFKDYKTHIKTTNTDLENEQKAEREKYEKQIGYLTYLGQDTNEALKLRSWYEIAPKRSLSTTEVTSVTEKDLKNKFTQDPLTLINALLPKENNSKIATKEKSLTASALSPDKMNINSLDIESSKEHNHKKHKKEKKCKKTKKSKSKEKKAHHKKVKKSKEKRNEKKKKLEEKQQQKRDLIERLRKERLKREKIEKERQEALLNPQKAIAVEHQKQTNAIPRVIQKYNSQFNPEIAKQNTI